MHTLIMHISHIVSLLGGTIVGAQRNWFIMHIVYCIGLIYDICIMGECFWGTFWVLTLGLAQFVIALVPT